MTLKVTHMLRLIVLWDLGIKIVPGGLGGSSNMIRSILSIYLSLSVSCHHSLQHSWQHFQQHAGQSQPYDVNLLHQVALPVSLVHLVAISGTII